MSKYIYILDYSYGGLLEIELDEEDVKDLEETSYDIIDDILEQYGIKGTDCNYMIVDNKLKIESIEKIDDKCFR